MSCANVVICAGRDQCCDQSGKSQLAVTCSVPSCRIPLGHLGGPASLSPLSPRCSFNAPSQAMRAMPGTPGHRETMEQHPCTHTLPRPPPPSAHRKHHRPARSGRLIAFCVPRPALRSSGNHEIPRAPSEAAQLMAKGRSGRGESLAGGSRAAPSSAPGR